MTRQIGLFALLASAAMAAVSCGGHGPTQPSVIERTVAPSNDVSTTIASTGTIATAHNSEQLVFSGTAIDEGSGSPVGFWIWCEVESGNPYADECNGAMYFYALGITAHVEDQENGIQETGDEIYQIKVHSTKDDSVACTLQNTAEPVHGPHNTVTVDCTSPLVHAVSSTAVVTVTGPGD
jgi:hypothetical protein